MSSAPRTMHLPPAAPSCHTTVWPVSVRAPAFWDGGRSCGMALTLETWATALEHTPKCRGCTRALRGLVMQTDALGMSRAIAISLAGVPWPYPIGDLSK